MWDELAVLWLVQPDLFTFETRPDTPRLRRLEGFQAAGVKALYLRLLGAN